MLNLQGVVLRQLGAYDDALRSISRAIRIKPGSSDFINNLGTVHVELRQFDEAARCFSHAVKLKPDSVVALENLGNVYLVQGLGDKAMVYYSRVLALQPGNIPVYCKVAKILRSHGRLDAVIRTYKQALQVMPESVEILYFLGGALEEQGNIRQAVDCYQRLLETRSDITDANICLARCLVTLSRPDDALKYCDNVLRLSPDNEAAVSIKAGILHRLGESQRAYDCLLPFLEKSTKNVDIALAYTDIAESMGRCKDAIGLLECIVCNTPNLPDSTLSRIHFSLGSLYDTVAEYDTAFGHFKQGNDLKVVKDVPSLYPNTRVMVTSFGRERLEKLPRSGCDSETPVFVVGMP